MNQILFGEKKRTRNKREVKERKEFRHEEKRIADYQHLSRPRGRGRRSSLLPGEQRTLESTLQEETVWYRTTNSGAAGAAVRRIAAVARSLVRSRRSPGRRLATAPL